MYWYSVNMRHLVMLSWSRYSYGQAALVVNCDFLRRMFTLKVFKPALFGLFLLCDVYGEWCSIKWVAEYGVRPTLMEKTANIRSAFVRFNAICTINTCRDFCYFIRAARTKK